MLAASFAEVSRTAVRRFTAQWRLKLALGFVMNIGFWITYLYLSRHALFPLRTLPLTPLDDWAGFHPRGWVWTYESAFLLTGIVPWLIEARADVWRYVLGFAGLCLASFIVFVVFPVASPRPVELSAYPTTLFLTRWDGPLNAFPSLHAACLVYVLATVWKLFGRTCPPVVKIGLLIWGTLILFATLATKQHYAVDLLAGGIIGAITASFAWSGSTFVAMASASTRRNRGVESQAG